MAVTPLADPESGIEVVSRPKISGFHNNLSTTLNIFSGKSKSKNKKDASEHRPKVETPPREVVTDKVEAKEATPPAVASEAVNANAEVQNDITPPEVVDGNCVSSTEKQNHVEVNHVGSSHDVDEDTSSSPPEVVEAIENGTATSSANNSNPASKTSSLIKLKYNYPEGKVIGVIDSE